MEQLHDFFVASVGAAAALIGLLFVAISLEPEKVFGEAADVSRAGRAIGSFTALANIFFVSLGGLTQHTAVVALIVALCSLAQAVSANLKLRRRYPELSGWRSFGLISAGIYLLEAAVVLRMVLAHGPADGLIYTIFGLYAYSLGTAWTLLGARGGAEV